MKKTIKFSVFLMLVCIGAFLPLTLMKDAYDMYVVRIASFLIAQFFFVLVLSNDLGGLVSRDNPSSSFPLSIAKVAQSIGLISILLCGVGLLVACFGMGDHQPFYARQIWQLSLRLSIGTVLVTLLLIFLFVDLAEKRSAGYFPAESI